MSTTDSISTLAPPVARTPLRNAITWMLRASVSVCRAVFHRRRGNRLTDLSERQLRDIGLTKDMLNHDHYGPSETERKNPGLEPRTSLSVLMLLMARGGA